MTNLLLNQNAKISPLEQGTPEWLKARLMCVTGTIAYQIYTLDNENIPISLVDKMLGKEKRFVSEAMREGTRLEPILRNQHIKDKNINFTPVFITQEREGFFNFAISLDGISDDREHILEIKTTGDSDLLEGKWISKISDQYMSQVQFCLLVSGALECTYILADRNTKRGRLCKIKPDPKWQETFLKKCEWLDTQEKKFYKEDPVLTEGSDLEKDIKQCIELKPVYDKVTKEYNKLKSDIKERGPNRFKDVLVDNQLYTLAVTNVISPPTLDLKKVKVEEPELYKKLLEKYSTQGGSYSKVSILKQKF